MNSASVSRGLVVALMAFAGAELGAVPPDSTAEEKAVAFLSREVPAWSRENGCYSCHNNGDAARALLTASRKGVRVERHTLADTVAWLEKPEGWDRNKGDPGFSDKRLANLQFAVALATAIETGFTTNLTALRAAARRVAADQETNGAWTIDALSAAGSPATYGTTLATHLAVQVLRLARTERAATDKGARWLEHATPRNVVEASALLTAFARATNGSGVIRKEEALRLIERAQTSEGGWGPFADSPAEPFDTALVLLALAELPQATVAGEMIARGRQFLIREQNADGSWPATTRPRGGESYAQQISTTGWATLALLRTRRDH